MFRPTLYDAGCSSAGGEDGDSDNDDEVEDGDGFTSYGMQGAECHPCSVAAARSSLAMTRSWSLAMRSRIFLPGQVNYLLSLEEKWKMQRRTVIPLRETILQPPALRRILLQRFTLLRAVVFRWHFVLYSIKRSPLWTGHDKMEYGK